MFTYNHELYETETRSHGMLHLYPTRTAGAHNVVRHRIPDQFLEFPTQLMEKMRPTVLVLLLLMWSFFVISSNSDEWIQMNCYIYQRNS